MRRRALIVGGGIGGLTAAITLRHLGLDVAVFERATDVNRIQIGTGLTLWSNAVRALGTIGLSDSVVAAGSPIEHLQFRTSTGARIADWADGEVARRLGAPPSVGIARADLHEVLLNAVGPDVLHFNARCVGVGQDDDGVSLRFADGHQEFGDLLIGADGLRSVVRSHLLGPADPDYAGYTAWRGMLPERHPLVPSGTNQVFWGTGARLILYTVGGGRPYWLALTKAPEGEQTPVHLRKRVLLGRYRDWCSPISELIELTDESTITRMDVYDRKPVHRWGTGRITLVGDAAHPMTPSTAQGACQAIEDSIALGKHLAAHSDVGIALRAYEAHRTSRTAAQVRRAHFIGSLSLIENPMVCAARNSFLRMALGGVMFKRHTKEMGASA